MSALRSRDENGVLTPPSRVAYSSLVDGGSPDHCLTEAHYRLWLSDPLARYGVENATLAPGYRAPATKT